MANCLILLKRILSKNNIKYVDIDGTVDTRKRQTNLNQYNEAESGVNVLLISKAGTEGVSTFGTRQIFICESQFNPASSEQAIARAIRFKSHMNLPENERHVQVYRLMLCLDDKDVQFCKDLTGGDLDARGAYVTHVKKTRKKRFDKLKNFFLKKLEGIKEKEIEPTTTIYQQYKPYEEAEIARQREAHRKRKAMFRKKKPFEYVRPKEEEMIDTIIKKKNITDKTILRLWAKLKKIDEDVAKHDNKDKAHVGGESNDDLTLSYSVDLRLENLTLIKKFKIDEVIHKMFIDEDGVQQVENYEDETTKHLKESLRSGKDPRTIILEQEQILNQRVKTYLKYAEKVAEMFHSINEMPEQNKEGEDYKNFTHLIFLLMNWSGIQKS